MKNINLERKVIIHADSEGNLGITYPNLECGLCLEEIIERSNIFENKYTIIDEKDLPQDYTYFNSWLYDKINGKISIDIEEAKKIQKNNIRISRKKLLEEQDVIFMRAVESGDSLMQKSAANTKQQLRDAPELVDNIEISGNTIDEISSKLESAWDDHLLGEKNFIVKRILKDDGSIEIVRN